MISDIAIKTNNTIQHCLFVSIQLNGPKIFQLIVIIQFNIDICLQTFKFFKYHTRIILPNVIYSFADS